MRKLITWGAVLILGTMAVGLGHEWIEGTIGEGSATILMLSLVIYFLLFGSHPELVTERPMSPECHVCGTTIAADVCEVCGTNVAE